MRLSQINSDEFKPSLFDSVVGTLTKTTCRKVVTFTSLAVLFTVYAVFVVYLGLFAYGNPDPNHCFYVDGLDTPAKSKQSVMILAGDRDIRVKTGYPIDMAHIFRTWFLWGFWDKIFQISIIAIFLPMALMNKSENAGLRRWLFYIFQTLSTGSFIAWFVIGFFWRFSRGGRVASGDKLERVAGTSDEVWKLAVEGAKAADGYQLKSGLFMEVFMFIFLISTSALVIFGSVLATLSCCYGRDR